MEKHMGTARANDEHRKVILDFCEQHPILLTRKRITANGRQESKKLWAELTIKLNSMGYGSKSTPQWQKVLADYKIKVKSKGAQAVKNMEKTGGGSGSEIDGLDIDESRFLGLLGPSSYRGDNVVEVGIKRKRIEPSVHIPTVVAKPSTSTITDHDYLMNTKTNIFDTVNNFLSLPISEEIELPMEESEAAPPLHSNNQILQDTVNTPNRNQSTSKRFFKRSKFEECMEEMNKEFLTVLKQINENMAGINDSLKSLAHSVGKK